MCALGVKKDNFTTEQLAEYVGRLATAFLKNHLAIWFEPIDHEGLTYYYAYYQIAAVRKLHREKFNFDIPITPEEIKEQERVKLEEVKKNKTTFWKKINKLWKNIES
jgi:hypothetical protein